MTLITPAGKPALSASSQRAKAENGVSGAGFIVTVHPAAKAAPTLEKKDHGISMKI